MNFKKIWLISCGDESSGLSQNRLRRAFPAVGLESLVNLTPDLHVQGPWAAADVRNEFPAAQQDDMFSPHCHSF